jgi:FkbM family methyltransferase
MQAIIEKSGLELENGKIKLPLDTKHVKLDIGLSYNAPHSQKWLSEEKGLIVFGFEPNPDSIASITNGATKRHIAHGDPLNKEHVGKSFFLLQCALSDAEGMFLFHCTAQCNSCDTGSSSLFKPSHFPIEKMIHVPVFRLDSFFNLFPFETHPIIDYIKIDAQGADLDIVKGAGSYIADHVAVITMEDENMQYSGTINSKNDMIEYMRSIGFEEIKNHPNGSFAADPTFVNSRFKTLVGSEIHYYQNG